MSSLFLIHLRIECDILEIESFAGLVPAQLCGEVRTRLGTGAPFNNLSLKYWRSSQFLTDPDKLSDDVIKLLAFIPKETIQSFAASVSVCLIERYVIDGIRQGYYLSIEALKAMAERGADFDFDRAQREVLDSGEFEPVP